jgi:hypothetical protein
MKAMKTAAAISAAPCTHCGSNCSVGCLSAAAWVPAVANMAAIKQASVKLYRELFIKVGSQLIR